MVWFQCEDCGENLKKPKLPTHFRICSASKLSCIDCGVIFNRQSVQNHTQCISETEKYGPKGAAHAKDYTKTKQQERTEDGVDTSLGLSTKAPWNCNLCNVKATSQETLLLHAQGKKHRSKARAASSKLAAISGCVNAVSADVPKEAIESTNKRIDVQSCNVGDSVQTAPLDLNSANLDHVDKHLNSSGKNHTQSEVCVVVISDGDSLKSKKNKKRKENADGESKDKDIEAQNRVHVKNGTPRNTSKKEQELLNKKKMENGHTSKRKKVHSSTQPPDEGLEQQKQKSLPKDWPTSIKWKKLIKQVLSIAPEGSMKATKLCKSLLPLVLKKIETFGLVADKEALLNEISTQIHSCEKVNIEGKTVRLANSKAT